MDDETIIALYWNRDDIAIRESAAISQGTSRSTDTSRFMRKKRDHGVFEAVLDELIEYIPSPSDSQDDVETAVLSAKISDFLRTLPPQQCDIFIRRYWFAEPAEAIAKRYDLSSGNVRMSLWRTRKNLKNFLREEGFIQ